MISPTVSARRSGSSYWKPGRSFTPPTSTTSAAFRTPASRNISGATRSGRPGTVGTQNYIGEKPQLNFGGRSIFWSGLIPTVQGWELDYFPSRVRQDLAGGLLNRAGETMNESRSMGATAQAVVARLRQSPLAADFSIQETPRALHQPYLEADGTPKDQFFTEPTGVFNTAELLVNQLGLTPGVSHGDGPGLHLLLNHYVEDVQNHGGHIELVARNTRTGRRGSSTRVRSSSPPGRSKARSCSAAPACTRGCRQAVKDLVGRGLTDHPTSNEITTFVTSIGNVALGKGDHAKIVFYSRGLRDANNEIRYPFNVEMNINHEYWHLRENDPGAAEPPPTGGAARIDIKFSFGNCLDDNNEVKPAPPFGYVPEIAFRNQSWADYLAESRFPALAGWHKNAGGHLGRAQPGDAPDLLAVPDQRPARSTGRRGLVRARGQRVRLGHGASRGGSLRMPYRPQLDAPFAVALGRRRGPPRRRHATALRLRHVRDAAQLGGQPGPHTGRSCPAAVATPRLNGLASLSGRGVAKARRTKALHLTRPTCRLSRFIELWLFVVTDPQTGKAPADDLPPDDRGSARPVRGPRAGAELARGARGRRAGVRTRTGQTGTGARDTQKIGGCRQPPTVTTCSNRACLSHHKAQSSCSIS